MTCAEFQKVLPYIIETGGNAEEEGHLESCPICSDLVQDLKYIAEQAKLLVPMHDPPAGVWHGIKGALEREGFIRPAAMVLPLRAPVAVFSPARWGTAGQLAAIAALVLIALGIMLYRNRDRRTPTHATINVTQPAVQPMAAAPVVVDDDDIRLLEAVEQQAPAMADTYKASLESVNAYISDARKRVEEDPADAEAREHLLQAYDQKSMVYEMALARSLQ
ncbi:MAG TPA: hypothetical protein VGQ71_11830 [Terriglobales bacterium]|nr:hypothetical protein [Terriglobales bacterium]